MRDRLQVRLAQANQRLVIIVFLKRKEGKKIMYWSIDWLVERSMVCTWYGHGNMPGRTDRRTEPADRPSRVTIPKTPINTHPSTYLYTVSQPLDQHHAIVPRGPRALLELEGSVQLPVGVIFVWV